MRGTQCPLRLRLRMTALMVGPAGMRVCGGLLCCLFLILTVYNMVPVLAGNGLFFSLPGTLPGG